MEIMVCWRTLTGYFLFKIIYNMAKQGNIHFSITADNDDFKLKLAETRQGILDSRKTAESEGTKIETMVKRTSMVAMNFFSSLEINVLNL